MIRVCKMVLPCFFVTSAMCFAAMITDAEASRLTCINECKARCEPAGSARCSSLCSSECSKESGKAAVQATVVKCKATYNACVRGCADQYLSKLSYVEPCIDFRCRRPYQACVR